MVMCMRNGKDKRLFIRWGFSPWTKLSGDKILVVGAGDPRHLVTSMAGDTGHVREFYLLEQNLHVYCRQVGGWIQTIGHLLHSFNFCPLLHF